MFCGTECQLSPNIVGDEGMTLFESLGYENVSQWIWIFMNCKGAIFIKLSIENWFLIRV